MQRALVLAVLAACRSSPPPLALLTAPHPPPASRPCEPSPARPALDRRFLPTTSGVASLLAATGDAVLSTSAGILAAWSADSDSFALADDGAVTLWRASDGAPLDLIVCPGGPIGANAIAMSGDLRWIAISGIQRAAGSEQRVTCIADRTAHEARVFPGETRPPAFDGATLIGHDRSIDLATGASLPGRPAAPPSLDGIDTEGAEQFAISHDGRYLAGWTTFEIVAESEGGGAPAGAPKPRFLAVWDRTTGKRLWRDDARCCWDTRFSAGDQFLERDGEARHELVRVTSGEVLSFPDPLLPAAPDGRRVLVLGQRGLELWSIEPPHPLVAAHAPRTPVARSRDGELTVALDGHGLALERPGRCVALGVTPDSRDAIELSPDDRELYVGVDQSLSPPGAILRDGELVPTVLTSTVTRWRTATGELLDALGVAGIAHTHPIPALGQVGFSPVTPENPDDQMWIYDLATHRLVTRTARPPLTASAAIASSMRWHGPLLTWELGDPRFPRTPATPRGYPTVVARSPDGQSLAIGTRGGDLAIAAGGGAFAPTVRHHDGAIQLLAFSPDGRILASASDRGLVLLTGAAGAPLGEIALTADRATLLWWSADGTQLSIDTARGFHLTIAVQR